MCSEHQSRHAAENVCICVYIQIKGDRVEKKDFSFNKPTSHIKYFKVCSSTPLTLALNSNQGQGQRQCLKYSTGLDTRIIKYYMSLLPYFHNA